MRFGKFCAALTISALLAAPSFGFANTTDPTEAATAGETVAATKLQLTLGSSTALLNDVPYQLEVPPEIVAGVSFLPIRFVTEQALSAAVQWDPETNLVQIARGEVQIKLDLAAGQALVNDQSVELSSPPIVKDGRTLVPLRFLAENFNIQVDYDPVLKTITIIDQTAAEEEPVNLPPVITSLGLQSAVLKIGEEAKYNFTYDNEMGESITQEWSCQLTGSDQIIAGQPRAFFRSGEYSLSLRIKDAAGNWSAFNTATFTVSDEVLMNEMDFKFSQPIYGELFENFDNFNFFNLKANNNVTFEHSGPVLHMSNSPEVVYQPGTLYRSEASGSFRFFFHHLNGAAERQYLYVIAENNNPYPVTLQAKKSGVGGPVTDYMNLGQLTAMRYLASQPSPAITINPGAKLILNQGMRFLNKGEAVTGMQDYQVDGAITLSVVMGPEKAPQPVPEPITELDTLLDSPTTPDPTDAAATGDTARDNVLILDINAGLSGQTKDTDNAKPPISETLSEMNEGFDAGAEPGTGSDSIFTPPPVKTPEQLLAEKIDYLLALPVLPRSSKQVRGVFPGADCLVNIQADGGTSEKVRLGIEEPGFDSWVEGVDPLTGETIKSVGNYGVVYRVKVTAPKKTGVMLNPRGSIFKAAVQSFNGRVYKAPETGFFTGAQKAAVLGVLAAGQTKEFTYTPSSGSDTPLIIALIPEKEWGSLDN